MIAYKTSEFSFEVANSYADISVETLAFLRNNLDDHLAIAIRLTELTVDQLQQINVEEIAASLDFLQEQPLDVVEPLDTIVLKDVPYKLPEDFCTETWGQKIVAFKALSEGDVVRIVACYTQLLPYEKWEFDVERLEKIEDMIRKLDVETVYGAAKFLIDQFKARMEYETKAIVSTLTHEQVQAGIKNFNVLGDFNTIDEIAGGDPLKYEDVLKIDYNTIFNKLLKNNITSRFEKLYHEIMSKKK